MKLLKISIMLTSLLIAGHCCFADTVIAGTLIDQYDKPVKEASFTAKGGIVSGLTIDDKGKFSFSLSGGDSVTIEKKGYASLTLAAQDMKAGAEIILKKDFHWTQLLQPQWYIKNGGLWFIMFAVFAETGLFAGFFLPGDSLLFVTGILSDNLVKAGLGIHMESSLVNLVILGIVISLAGVLGNFVGYWFGRKSGPFLFERKDTFLFKKKYLLQAKEFYDQHGGGAIVFARFLPIIRTFAPIIAGIVAMDKKTFTFYNIIGCVGWVFSMLFAGHYLQILFMRWFHFDLKEHLEVIVIGIVLLTTAPILIKLFFGKKKKPGTDIAA